MVLMVLHDGRLKAPSEGRPVAEPRDAGGIGGRPGVRMCAVWEGRRLEGLRARLPVLEPAWAGAPFAEAMLSYAGGGGE